MRWTKAVASGLLASVLTVVPVRAENVSDNPVDLLQPIMSISTGRRLSPAIAARIVRAVASSGATASIVGLPTVGLTAHARDGETLLRLRSGWRIPMATMVAPAAYLQAVGGGAMVTAAGEGNVLIGRTAATIRGAKVGDLLELRDAKFRPVTFRIGAIVSDSFVDWGELFITTESAAPLGDMPLSRIDVTNIRSPKSVVSTLRKKGFPMGGEYRLRTSWDLPNPDGTLGTANTKKLLGEFAFRPTVGSSIVVSTRWASANIAWRNEYSGIKLRNNCHRVVSVAIQGALSDIKKAGLQSEIDVDNSNQFGGCFVGRYNRLGGTFGAPSRHAWGMALDINTSTNKQGSEPAMNCDVVRIFRKWGFAWGGNFWPTDGMHFEYVGRRRDRIGYPSKYCPNKATVPSTTLPPFVSTTTSGPAVNVTTTTTLPPSP